MSLGPAARAQLYSKGRLQRSFRVQSDAAPTFSGANSLSEGRFRLSPVREPILKVRTRSKAAVPGRGFTLLARLRRPARALTLARRRRLRSGGGGRRG